MTGAPGETFDSGDTRGQVCRQRASFFPFDIMEQTFAIGAVPEPGVLAMLGCGLGMVAFAARRRRT